MCMSQLEAVPAPGVESQPDHGGGGNRKGNVNVLPGANRRGLSWLTSVATPRRWAKLALRRSVKPNRASPCQQKELALIAKMLRPACALYRVLSRPAPDTSLPKARDSSQKKSSSSRQNCLPRSSIIFTSAQSDR